MIILYLRDVSHLIQIEDRESTQDRMSSGNYLKFISFKGNEKRHHLTEIVTGTKIYIYVCVCWCVCV